MTLPVVNEVITYTITLPSTKERVEMRPYYVGEEKALLMAMESGDESQMLNVLKNIIHSCSNGKLNPNKLSLIDVEYIYLQLRSKSVGETSDIRVKCTNTIGEDICGHYNEVTVPLDKVSISPLPEREIKLSNLFTLVMNYPSYNDVINLSLDKTIGDVERTFRLACKCLDHIKGEDKLYSFSEYSDADIEKWLNALNDRQIKSVIKFIESQPAIYYDLDFTCTKCGHANKAHLEGILDFF